MNTISIATVDWHFDDLSPSIEDGKRTELSDITFREALVLTEFFVDEGSRPVEFIDLLRRREYDACEINSQHLKNANEIILYWQFEMMNRKLMGEEIRWPIRRSGDNWAATVAQLVARPDERIAVDERRLVSNLRHFTQINKRYDDYAALYKTVDRSDTQYTGKLQYVEHYAHNTAQSNKDVYVFRREDNCLMFWTFNKKYDYNTQAIVDYILDKDNGVMNIDTYAKPKRIHRSLYVSEVTSVLSMFDPKKIQNNT